MDNKNTKNDGYYKSVDPNMSGSYRENNTQYGNPQMYGDAFDRVMNPQNVSDINSLNNDMMHLQIDEQTHTINNLYKQMNFMKQGYENKLKSVRRWRTAIGILSLGVGIAFGAIVSGYYVSRYLYNTDNAWVISRKKDGDTLSKKTSEKLDSLTAIIDARFLNDYKEEDLENYMYKGLIAGLDDPYSAYYTKEEYTKMLENSSGVYKGIGVYVSQDPETKKIEINSCFEGGPAEEAGLKAGDVIIKVEDEDITGQELEQVVAKIKGEEGKPVKVTVIREENGEEKELDFNVDRREIEVKTVKYEMLDDNIGYIQISEFEELTTKQFKAAYADLKKQQMKGLVVDLRDNPGGLLDSVSDILDYLLPEGLVVYTQDKYGNKDEFKSDKKAALDVPMTVLINGNSASASEIFAGAIQDYEAGKLVGTTSFGKGIVQEIRTLSDGSAIKLTIADYYTPKGRNIHGKGIDPDVEIEYDKEAMGDEYDKSRDNQLKKALDEVKTMTDK